MNTRTTWLPAFVAVALIATETRAGDADETLEASKKAPPPEAVSGSPAPEGPYLLPDWLRRLHVDGYVQAQYTRTEDSQDQLTQGGASLNKDQFSVRRARLRVDGVGEYTSASIELDGNTTKGLSAGFRRAEVSVFLPSSDKSVPYVRAGGGLTDIHFGQELTTQNRERLFMERSLLSQAFFPYEADVGARLDGGFGPFRYALSVMNGQPFGNGSAPATAGDPNAGKDLLARFGVEVDLADGAHVSGGTSFLRGRGFHPGTSATKSTVVWVDANENAQVDMGEIVGVPGTSATPSANFDRWAANLDLRLTIASPVGKSSIYGELTAGANMDRGLFPADPIASGGDTREVGYYVAFIHEWRALLVGVRLDYYDPNGDFFEKRAGKLLPSTQRLRATSPVLGLRIGEHVRLMAEYDFNSNYLATDAVGVPTNLANNELTVRLQGSL